MIIERRPGTSELAVIPTALLLTTILAASCSSMPSTPKRMYAAVMEDLQSGKDASGGLVPVVLMRQTKRYEQIVSWHTDGTLESAEDFYYAALSLSTSDVEEYIVLTKELAIRAAEEGEERGFLLQAYATDLLQYKRGEPFQTYGTNLVYDPATESWYLHPPVDPLSDDALRRSMGVPPMAQIMAEIEELNRGPLTSRLRKDVKTYPWDEEAEER